MNEGKATTPLGREIAVSLRQVKAHLEVKLDLPVRPVEVPDQVDVRALRTRLRRSQTEFAKRFGFSSRAVQEWEQGRRTPDSGFVLIWW